jgi:Homocysteine/selenocysteine methylase (S-methylmethionine-dependent)
LPQLDGRPMVTDGGMETDLIFHHGVDLPLFAAFPLVDTPAGRSLLTAYYDEYAAIARRAGAGLMLESATWRANPDWGDRLGYSPADLARVNRDAISMLAELRERYRGDLADVVISGMVGPGRRLPARRGTGPDEAADYHAAQVEALAAAGADIVSAYTLTSIGEAIGIVRAASSAGVPAAISFTTETDGRLPGGESLAEAITRVDAAASRRTSRSTCAHPVHVAAALADLAPGGSGSTACATTPPPGATPSWTRRPTWTRATSCWPAGTGSSPPACRPWPSWADAAGRTPVTSRPSGTSPRVCATCHSGNKNCPQGRVVDMVLG